MKKLKECRNKKKLNENLNSENLNIPEHIENVRLTLCAKNLSVNTENVDEQKVITEVLKVIKGDKER